MPPMPPPSPPSPSPPPCHNSTGLRICEAACDAEWQACNISVRANPTCADGVDIDTCVERKCRKRQGGQTLLERCKEACNDVPICPVLFSWDPGFNNSCFGATYEEAAFAKQNGVCDDGGPGAVDQLCAFGTSAPVIIIALALIRFASSSPGQPRLYFGLAPAPAL